MVIWAATAVTDAINATRVMVDAFNASLSMKEAVAPRPPVGTGLLLPLFVPDFRQQSCQQTFDSSASG